MPTVKVDPKASLHILLDDAAKVSQIPRACGLRLKLRAVCLVRYGFRRKERSSIGHLVKTWRLRRLGHARGT